MEKESKSLDKVKSHEEEKEESLRGDVKNKCEHKATEDSQEFVDDEDEDDTEEEDEEPKLKYARITTQLGPIYRNGDATSTFLVAGDKMFIGTHNGNVHVASLPSFKFLRVYHAHSASISSISISPLPLPLKSASPQSVSRIISQAHTPQRTTVKNSIESAPVVPNIPSNAIYIATSSIDGNVCVQSLVDVKDVQLRNFGRPVQAVALSPEYRNDKTYLSGGLAGKLILTVGGKPGTSSISTTVGGTSATTSEWLGVIGMSGNNGRDTVLHSSEGIISTIKWSLSGKYVAWINEHGIKIMRSNIHLESADNEYAWKRIGHIDRPDDSGWEEMASIWRGRIEWIDESSFQDDEGDNIRHNIGIPNLGKPNPSISNKIEKLIVGWGGTVWIINVHPGGDGLGTIAVPKGRSVGRPEIVKILRMDCIISGLSLFAPNLLLVLAYIVTEDKAPKDQIGGVLAATTKSGSKHKIGRRLNAVPPELRLIDISSSEEVDTDTLTVSRFEGLSASDYHLGVIPAFFTHPTNQSSRSTFETLIGVGSGMWNATINATSLLNSSASIRSSDSKVSDSTKQNLAPGLPAGRVGEQNVAHPSLVKAGLKVFIHSPFDCIFAIKRDLSDHLSWLIDHDKYKEAWELIDEHPEITSSSVERLTETTLITPSSKQPSTDYIEDSFDDSSTINSTTKLSNSSHEKEKRRIGELWIHQLIRNNEWIAAGKICGKVLRTAKQWEDFIFIFVGAKKFDEITEYIPSHNMMPPLKSEVYEVILGYYIARNRPRAKELLDRWPADLFNIKSVIIVLENQLRFRDVREDSIEDGQVGRDWRIVIESLGRLYLAGGQVREALKCYIKLQNAETAMKLIKDYHLIDALAEDLPGLILLRVSKQQIDKASLSELKEATSEVISMLVNEAQHGLVSPTVVVQQLQQKNMTLYLFFYLSSLWSGDGIQNFNGGTQEKLLQDSRAYVDQFSDLALRLFAIYDRELLMEFLRYSTTYTFEQATQECEERDFIPELVYLYSKTGQTKRALNLIIDRLGDVSQAILFAKEQNDNDLWEDLLSYSLDKPGFIRVLLEEVGTTINPINLVRRIPEGLEITGLREGLRKMIKEYEIQHSISHGVAKVFRGEVATAQNTLRSGQRKGIKFDVAFKSDGHIDPDSLALSNTIHTSMPNKAATDFKSCCPIPPEPGLCMGCRKPLSYKDIETLVGFACGHVWHLSHLFLWQHPGQPITPSELELIGNDKRSASHSVGAKVTHARLLKDKIPDGCPICKQDSVTVKT